MSGNLEHYWPNRSPRDTAKLWEVKHNRGFAKRRTENLKTYKK